MAVLLTIHVAAAASMRPRLRYRVVDDGKAAHRHVHRSVDSEVAAWPRRRFGRELPEFADFYRGPSGRRAADLVRRLYGPDLAAYGYADDGPGR